MYGICTLEEPFWMILEFCDNGSLKGKPHCFNIQYLIRKSDKTFLDILLEFGLLLFFNVCVSRFSKGSF